MLKGFNELRELDLSQYIKKRDGADYLPWAVCVDLLHQNGAEYVDFEPLTNANGSSFLLRMITEHTTLMACASTVAMAVPAAPM